jgi:hypothetical protein
MKRIALKNGWDNLLQLAAVERPSPKDGAMASTDVNV